MVLYPLFIIVSLFSTISMASSRETPETRLLCVDNAWVRAVEVGNSAAYMTISNNGSVDDRLISVQTDACEKVELHTHLKEGHIYKMRPVKAIDLPAKQVTSLAEGGLHIMLLNVRPLKENVRLKLILNFEKAGQIPIVAEIRKKKCDCSCED